MGFFDNLGNLSPEQTQGLLGFASQLLQAGGQSRTPTSFGQALGSGLQGYQTSFDQAQQRKMEQAIKGLQLRSLTGELDDKEISRKQAREAQDFLRKYNAGTSSPTAAAQQVLGQNLAPTMANADLLAQAQSQQQGQQPDQSTERLFNQRIAQAQAMRATGNPTLVAQADALEKQALEFRDEYSTTPQYANDQSGNPYAFVLSKRGGQKRLDGVLPRDEMKLLDTGGGFQAYNSFALKPGQQFAKTNSPSDLITLHGQNMTDQRAKDANEIAKRSNMISTSTGLRKEFDDLPEAKNYKQALPAYNAVVDAASRNTPQSDINLVYGIAKLYDPNSVVREGEYATVANSPSIPERIKGYAQYIAGGGRLSEGTKKQIQDEAAGRIKSYEDQFTQARQNYQTIASNSGGSASLLFPSEFKPAVKGDGGTAGIFSVTAPNGKTYTFPDAKSLANFKMKAGL